MSKRTEVAFTDARGSAWLVNGSVDYVLDKLTLNGRLREHFVELEMGEDTLYVNPSTVTYIRAHEDVPF